MKIASIQMPNSLSIEENFRQILYYLHLAVDANCDLVLFPECSLSGFSSEIKKCSMDFLRPYFDQLKHFSFLNNITIVLPSAYVEGNKIYNAVFIFEVNLMTIQYKIGLTESEKKFFSIPDSIPSKIFSSKGFRIGILVCFEAQMRHDFFIREGKVDLILWPGYISSGEKKEWDDSEKNEVYQNMMFWKVPLIQSNFSFNDFSIGKDRGPDGHSVFLSKENKLIKRGKYRENDMILINFSELD